MNLRLGVRFSVRVRAVEPVSEVKVWAYPKVPVT